MMVLYMVLVRIPPFSVRGHPLDCSYTAILSLGSSLLWFGMLDGSQNPAHEGLYGRNPYSITRGFSLAIGVHHRLSLVER